MPVKNEKQQALEKEMERLKIYEEDLKESFVLGSGKGGQKIQKTSSCVVLLHLPTHIQVRCSKERSQSTNRYLARKMLCDKIKEVVFDEQTDKQKKIEKQRRQKQRRARRSKNKPEES